ncbi:MAG: DUF2341 domain-containing protein [Candidatus Hodarchaeota archaeon]
MKKKGSRALYTLLFLGFLCIGLFSTNIGNDGSKNESYQYMNDLKQSAIVEKIIYINPSTPEDNYTIRLDLDSGFDYGSCLPGGDDIRFYDASNDSLPYWIEEWNAGGNSTIWIKVLQSGTSSIKMEYGDANASAASNGDSTFEFFDDFSGSDYDTSKWDNDTDLYSTITVSGGIVTLLSGPTIVSWPTTYLGFQDTEVARGIPYGTSANNTLIERNDGFFTRNETDQLITNNGIYETWSTIDMAWINWSSAKFYLNDAYHSEHTDYIPNSTIPLKLVAIGLDYPAGNHFATMLVSKNATLGQPGYAIRSRFWNHWRYSASQGTDKAELRVDFVFVKKCSAIEPKAAMPVINNLPYSEDFEWDAIPHPNDQINTWQPIFDGNGDYTGWDAIQEPTTNMILANNFVNTTQAGGSTSLHMENRDDSYNGTKYGRVRTDIDASGHLNNFTFEVSVQGYRYDSGTMDVSIATIFILEDTNNDGNFNINTEYGIQYILDYDGDTNYDGFFNGTGWGNVTYLWEPISTDWDGSTWYHIQKNITQDWIDIHGFSPNKTRFQVLFTNTMRTDTTSTSYYMWTNWDNFTITGERPRVVHKLPYVETFDWGLIPAINDQINLWEPIMETIGSYTGWEAQLYTPGNMDLGYNVINTTMVNGGVCLHLENHDDTYSGRNYAFARTFLNVTGFLDNFTFQVDVQGSRNDPTDRSSPIIEIFEDTDGDGEVDRYSDHGLRYVLDYNGWDDISQIENSSYFNYTNIWVPISNDWDGLTWYHVAKNITEDWLTYKGFALNSTILMIQFQSGIRADSSSPSNYQWTNWDNFTTNVEVIPPDVDDPVILLVDPADGQMYNTTDIPLNIQVTDANLDTIWYEIDGTNPIEITANGTITVPEGDHEIIFYANDTAGNVASESVNITVELSGIVLSPGFGTYDQLKSAYHIEFNIYMNDWGVLRFSAPAVTDDSPTVVGINGQLKPVFMYQFGILVEDAGDVNFSSMRIYYDDGNLPSGVKEDELIVLKWNEDDDAWEAMTTIININGDYVECVMDADAVYMLVGRTANNDITIIIIIMIASGCAAGIVSAVGYKNRYKKRLKQKVTIRGKKKSVQTYQDLKGVNIESFRKRQRLMRQEMPTESSQVESRDLLKVKKKARVEKTEEIDVNRRMENIEQIEETVDLKKDVEVCLIHRGPISGLNYKCKECGSNYCMACAMHLATKGESCWNCGAQLADELKQAVVKDDTGIPIPHVKVTMFSRDVWEKLVELESDGRIEEEFLSEVIAQLKDIPPGERLQFLNLLPEVDSELFDDFEDEDDVA